MATKLDHNELVEIRELFLANELYMEALVELLVEKGILSKHELLERIKKVQMRMLNAKGH